MGEVEPTKMGVSYGFTQSWRPMGFQQKCGENGSFNGKTIGKP
jgi:hypothetical protein